MTYHTIHPFIVYNSIVFSTFTEFYNHHHNRSWDTYIIQKEIPYCYFPPAPLALVYLLWRVHSSGIVHHVVFCNRLLSFSIKFSMFIHVVAAVSTSFIFIRVMFHVYGYITTYSSVDGHLGRFHFCCVFVSLGIHLGWNCWVIG